MPNNSNRESEEFSLKEHLVELGIRLKNSLLALLLASLIVSILPAQPKLYPYVPLVTRIPSLIVSIVTPRQIVGFDGKLYNVTIIPSSPFESLSLIFYASILLGFIAASPIIAREIWLFIEPALYPHEKRLVKRYVFFFTASFIAGALFGLYIVAPLIMKFTLSLLPLFAPEGYELIIRIGIEEVASFGIQMAITMGVVAEAPIVLYILLAYGIIDPSSITKDTMKWILLGSLIVGALISPDPSGIGMLAIGGSIYLPLHIAVRLGKKTYYKRRLKETIVEKEIA